MSLIGISNMYGVRPSEMLDIDDPYTAYCLDEACAFIRSKLDDGEEPVFRRKVSSFKDLYAKFK